MSNLEEKPPDGKDPNNNEGDADNSMEVTENNSEPPKEEVIKMADAMKQFQFLHSLYLIIIEHMLRKKFRILDSLDWCICRELLIDFIPYLVLVHFF